MTMPVLAEQGPPETGKRSFVNDSRFDANWWKCAGLAWLLSERFSWSSLVQDGAEKARLERDRDFCGEQRLTGLDLGSLILVVRSIEFAILLRRRGFGDFAVRFSTQRFLDKGLMAYGEAGWPLVECLGWTNNDHPEVSTHHQPPFADSSGWSNASRSWL